MDKNSINLSQEKIGRLLFQYALPSAISGLIGAAYNIVDQIFIGHQVGMLGNAATNIVFPIVTLTTALGLMTGVGTSSGFSQCLGERKLEDASKIVCNGLTLMAIAGILITLLVQVFLEPLLLLCGATTETLPLAVEYQRITGYGIFFFILSSSGSAIIRSDGNPGYALLSVIIGAALNVFLDALFMIGFDMGITGAAWATLIGQIVSGIVVIYYFLRKFQSVPLKSKYYIPDFKEYLNILKLGTGPFFNNVSLVLVQIMLNNALVKWGAESVFGSDIPLACAGIVSKVSAITNSIVVGIAQGSLPIISYNYGAKNYQRTRETGLLSYKVVTCFSVLVFLCFQLLPRQLTMLFGTGDEIFFEFAENYFRIFMMLTFVSGLPITTGNFFTALGKPHISVLVFTARQLIAFPLFLAVLPQFFGLDGVIYSGPLSEGLCVIVAVSLFAKEYKRLGNLAKTS